ncbi:ABC transporter substrate-binding protein [Natronolimnobius sp. AArcel1]|uniref:ABC transporter substrate-binding protein n=1 Tax=Natronolimnobius sp. AArcel1 TaxID=1679093 RepID=UPI0013ED2A89|nr:ABC transporter substrate-binding protein [Natronolimnobius sp. AArcel1]NGM69800.1 ABC transporter substrate-binding protein [Natronolimnobius sp. AArcel1]
MPANNHRKEYLSRRKLLALSGATGAAALAGCFGGDDDDASDIIPGQELDTVEVDYNENYEDEWDEAVPAGDVNPYNDQYLFNPYTPAWDSGDGGQEFTNEYLSVYNTETGEFVERIADGWDIDDDLTTTIDISDEYGWSNGDDITAHDFETEMRLAAYMEMGMQDFVDPDEGIYAEDDYTLVIEPRDEYTDLEEELWMNNWAETILQVNDEQYGTYIEQFEEAEDEDEMQSIREDVLNFEPSWDEALFSGPFVFVEANEQYADQVPNPEHPIAQDWEFYLRYGVYTDEEGAQAGEVDWVHNDPTIEDLPDIYDEPPVSFSGQSFAIIFGIEDEYIREYPEVRQAIAYAIDMENLVEVAAPGTPVDEYSTGIDYGYVENFVHEDVLDAMPNYAPQDTDMAAELLEDVGFENDGDEWLTPDGDTWTLNFPVGDWFETHSEVMSNNLAEFGIDMDYYVEEFPTWESETDANLDYDLTVHLNYGMARDYHPYADLDEEFNNPDRGLFTERTGIVDEEVEVPEVGNPDGDMVTFNIEEELEAIATAADEDELMEHSSNLAWVHNQLLPGVTVFPWSEHYFVNAEDWDFDLETDDWLTSNRIAHYLVENGLQPE